MRTEPVNSRVQQSLARHNIVRLLATASGWIATPPDETTRDFAQSPAACRCAGRRDGCGAVRGRGSGRGTVGPPCRGAVLVGPACRAGLRGLPRHDQWMLFDRDQCDVERTLALASRLSFGCCCRMAGQPALVVLPGRLDLL